MREITAFASSPFNTREISDGKARETDRGRVGKVCENVTDKEKEKDGERQRVFFLSIKLK